MVHTKVKVKKIIRTYIVSELFAQNIPANQLSLAVPIFILG